MSQTRQTSPLDRLLEPFGRSLTPAVAQELAELRATPEVQARIDELAEKCNEGTLTKEERGEYESYVQAIHLIGILQAKARAVLGNGSRQP
jgi:hypothetical protein